MCEGMYPHTPLLLHILRRGTPEQLKLGPDAGVLACATRENHRLAVPLLRRNIVWLHNGYRLFVIGPTIVTRRELSVHGRALNVLPVPSVSHTQFHGEQGAAAPGVST